MATIFECNFEDGSGLANTGGAYTFTVTNGLAGEWEEDNGSVMWGTDSAHYNDNGDTARYVYGDPADADLLGIRFGFRIDTEGLASGNLFVLMRYDGESGAAALLSIFITDNAGQLQVLVKCLDGAWALQQVGSAINISLDTTYQIVIKWDRNAANGCAWKLYAQDGTTQVGAEQTLSGSTTINETAVNFRWGGCAADWYTLKFYLDELLIINTYDYPTTVQAAGGLSILPTGIGSGQVIGSHRLNRYIVPSGIASAEAIGAFKANFAVQPTGIASGQAFGTAQLNRYITPTGLASGESFGTARIGRRVAPSGMASAEAFGTHRLSRNITPDGIASDEAFGSHRLSMQIVPSGISSGESIGSHRLGAVVGPSGIASGESFGSHVLRLVIFPNGIVSGEAIGSHLISTAGVTTIAPNGIASGESFGTSKMNFFILPSGIATGEAMGTARISRYILASGIVSSEAFGNPSLSRFILPNGIASAEGFGSHKLNLAILSMGIGTGEALGTSILIYPQMILPAGIISAESLGAVVVLGPASQTIVATGIASGESFGTIWLYRRDWNELLAKILYLLRTDTDLRILLNKASSPYGVYFSRPPNKPAFPLLTVRFIEERMGEERNPQQRIVHVDFKAYSATNPDQILERVEEIVNHAVSFTGMVEYRVSHARLDSIGPDDFDAEFNTYTSSHQYTLFVDHHQI